MPVVVTIKDACGYPTDISVNYSVSVALPTLRTVLAEKENQPEEKLTKRFWFGRILDR